MFLSENRPVNHARPLYKSTVSLMINRHNYLLITYSSLQVVSN